MPDILELDVDSKWLARQLRESGRTQAELARYLGLTAPQINKTLKGRRKCQPCARLKCNLLTRMLRLPYGPSLRVAYPSTAASASGGGSLQ